MAEKTLNTRQKQKYDTSTNWTTNNPVLLAGELGIESDTNKFKIGNGTSTWNELDYAGGSEIPLYSTTGQNTDGAMTQKAVSDALPQAVTVTLTGSQNFNDIVITNEQLNLLLSNPENYLIVEMTSSNLTVSLKYRRSQYFTVTSGNVFQEALIFNCVNSTSFAPYAERINSMTLIRQTQNGETNIAVQDDTLDFTTFVPKTRTINGKSLSNNITLTATDVGALPDTTEIPSTLADLTDDSTHRTVTDTEKSTWNAKSDFSGSYNDLTNKPTIPTDNAQLTNGAGYTKVTVNDVAQTNLDFDSDPQTQIDNIVNNTTKIQNQNGGFSAGDGANTIGGGAVGYNASANSGGGAVGYNASANSGGGAVGNGASANSGGAVGFDASAKMGGAVGYNASANSGGAVGYGARTSNGFAGGNNAKAVNENGSGIDAIQLGTGTNTTEKSLQIYDDNIYNASTHTLTASTITAASNLNCDTDNVWFGGGQSENVVDNHAIKTISSSQIVNNNSNNYVRYNSGLIIQWGHAPINTDNNVRITFSYPFIDANYSIVVLDGDNTDWNNYLNGYRLDGTKAGTDLRLGKSSTQCQIAKRGCANDFDWIAIGRWK